MDEPLRSYRSDRPRASTSRAPRRGGGLDDELASMAGTSDIMDEEITYLERPRIKDGKIIIDERPPSKMTSRITSKRDRSSSPAPSLPIKASIKAAMAAKKEGREASVIRPETSKPSKGSIILLYSLPDTLLFFSHP